MNPANQLNEKELAYWHAQDWTLSDGALGRLTNQPESKVRRIRKNLGKPKSAARQKQEGPTAKKRTRTDQCPKLGKWQPTLAAADLDLVAIMALFALASLAICILLAEMLHETDALKAGHKATWNNGHLKPMEVEVIGQRIQPRTYSHESRLAWVVQDNQGNRYTPPANELEPIR